MNRSPLSAAKLRALEDLATDLANVEGAASVSPVARLALGALELIEQERQRRAPLPGQRRGLRYSPRIGGGPSEGGVRVYVSTSVVEGKIAEVFVDVQLSQGTTLVELGHVLARLVTRALRAGADLVDIIEDLRGTTGGPEGLVWDCEGVDHAGSLPDLVGQVLELARGTAPAPEGTSQ